MLRRGMGGESREGEMEGKGKGNGGKGEHEKQMRRTQWKGSSEEEGE